MEWLVLVLTKCTPKVKLINDLTLDFSINKESRVVDKKYTSQLSNLFRVITALL